MQDPEYCNALAAKLWELPVLARHFHPVMAAKAGGAIARAKDGLALLGPLELCDRFSNMSQFDLNPAIPLPSPRPGDLGPAGCM